MFDPDPNPETRPPGGFPTTRWTLVDSLGRPQAGPEHRDWDHFAKLYAPVLVNSLVRKGLQRTDAEDLVQSLLLKLWQSDAFPGALRKHHGRLRTYLLVCLKNLWNDHRGKQARQKRGNGVALEELNGQESVDAGEIAVFDQEWAKSIVLSACERLHREYTIRGQERFFEEGLKLLRDDTGKGRAEVTDKLDLKANTLSVGLKRLRERLSQTVREEIAAVLHEPNEEALNSEIEHLLRALSEAGGLPSYPVGHPD